VTREQAAAELRNFIEPYAGPNDDVAGVLKAIEDSIRRFVKSKSSLEVRDQARRIAKAAKAFHNALEESDSCWPWLLSGRHGVPARGRVLLEVREIEDAAHALARRLSPGKRQVDDLRSALAFELAGHFRMITGVEPTFSNSADFENNHPGTKFSHLVHVALTGSRYSSHPRVHQLLDSLPSFVTDAARQIKNPKSPFGEKPAEKTSVFLT
jgi:hypothetical protein